MDSESLEKEKSLKTTSQTPLCSVDLNKSSLMLIPPSAKGTLSKNYELGAGAELSFGNNPNLNSLIEEQNLKNKADQKKH
jgi:hypothetical protein